MMQSLMHDNGLMGQPQTAQMFHSIVTEVSDGSSIDDSVPVHSITRRLLVDDDPTRPLDVAITVFSNRIVFVASELHGAIGNWVLSKASEAVVPASHVVPTADESEQHHGANSNTNNVVSTRVVFGADEDWLHILARRITSALASTKSVLCSFSIKDRQSVESVNKISTLIVEFIRQLKAEQQTLFNDRQ